MAEICGDDRPKRKEMYHTVGDFEDGDKFVTAPDKLQQLSKGWAGKIIGALQAHIKAQAESKGKIGDYTEQELNDDTIPF